MRARIAMAAMAMLMAGPAAAQEAERTLESPSLEMRTTAALRICGAYASESLSRDQAVAEARALAFEPGPQRGRLRFDDARTGDQLALEFSPVGFCSLRVRSLEGEPADRLARGAEWIARVVPGPWRLMSEVSASGERSIDGHNGTLSLSIRDDAFVPGQLRFMLMDSDPAAWTEGRALAGAEPLPMELPPYEAPSPSEPAAGPARSVREVALSALRRCYAFQQAGDRQALVDGLLGEGFVQGPGPALSWTDGWGDDGFDLIVGAEEGPGSGQRACGLYVMTRPVDRGLMQEAVDLMRDNQRGFSRSNQETGLPCVMQHVILRDRAMQAQAQCNMMAAEGQPTIALRLDTPSGL